jgi:endonuclease YncB( thermonuclease family)
LPDRAWLDAARPLSLVAFAASKRGTSGVIGSALRATALVLALAGLPPGLVQAQVEGSPRIIDGATLEIAGQRFRLHGIAVPALDRACRRARQDYPCGKVARAALWDLVGGLEVSCLPVAAAARAGGAGESTPATCTAGGTDLNQGMVETGWALADRAASEAYPALEADAAAARRGLWSGEFDLPGTRRASTE